MQTITKIDEILARLRVTEQDLEQEVDSLLVEKRQQFNYSLRRGKVVFERSVQNWQRQHRTGLWQYLRRTPLTYIFSAPVIYGMIVPLLVLDLSITLYQHICFRIYGIPLVKRTDYLVIDRHLLAYLNAIEKINCTYCGYGNGLIEYAREIVGRTEQYWCPIKHAQKTLDPHHRTLKYCDFGDAEAWSGNLETLRKDLVEDLDKSI
ncbi:MAG: hypothetical protein DRQ48_07100 [Gammaproteobacteria bacterium]|nr:MAG: hypothetical protein DRQ58_10520 [Gammaproteobacteria bacterium]RKZ69952.1 MAG: hypothetical protein DRQ48_07100 [Gammaproteobacteria bacterium]